eukprot:COSAG06_NODE_12235_length_1405_cov_165.610260_1_plen_33_part_10
MQHNERIYVPWQVSGDWADPSKPQDFIAANSEF